MSEHTYLYESLKWLTLKELLNFSIFTLRVRGNKISLKFASYSSTTCCRILLSTAPVEMELNPFLKSDSYKANVNIIYGWAILCLIIQYFWMLTPLPLKILFIFSLFVDNAQIINPLKFQPSTPYGFKAIEIWIHHFEFTFSVITIVLLILLSWNLVWVSFLRWEIQKSHLEYLKINQS